MTSNRSKRKFSWWPGDAEWISQKVDKWLVSGNGYSKLRASISTRSCNSVTEHDEPVKAQPARRSSSIPVQPSQPPATATASTSKLKLCLKYGEEVYKNYSERLQGSTRRPVPVSRSFSAKEGKKPIQRQDWARSSHSLRRRNDDRLPKREGSFKSKTLQRFTSNVVPAEIIFEKCRPRERRGVPCEPEPCWDEVVPCCVESSDVIYYPFREEDCVVCKYMLKSANHFRMNVEPLEHVACTSDGCHFLYGSKSFPCDTGQLHSGCKLTPTMSLVNTMSRCSLRETRIASDEPDDADAFYENNFQTQPTININQNYIEVRYDDSIEDVNGNVPVHDSASDSETEVYRRQPQVDQPKPERPPPTYMSVMRQDSSRVRPRKCTYQRQDGEDRFYVHDSPLRNPARYPPSYESCADDCRFNINRSTNLVTVPRRTNTMPRQNARENPKYRSRGRFSHSFYDTERAVRDAFEVNGNGNPWNSNLRRGNSFSYYTPVSTVVVDNQSPRYQHQLREVDLRSSNPLRNVMSFSRSRNGKSSSRRKKSVVVGEDGLQGPMWPRVLLTFDRGVTPNAPPYAPSYASGQYVPSMESDM